MNLARCKVFTGRPVFFDTHTGADHDSVQILCLLDCIDNRCIAFAGFPVEHQRLSIAQARDDTRRTRKMGRNVVRFPGLDGDHRHPLPILVRKGMWLGATAHPIGFFQQFGMSGEYCDVLHVAAFQGGLHGVSTRVGQAAHAVQNHQSMHFLVAYYFSSSCAHSVLLFWQTLDSFCVHCCLLFVATPAVANLCSGDFGIQTNANLSDVVRLFKVDPRLAPSSRIFRRDFDCCFAERKRHCRAFWNESSMSHYDSAAASC